MSILENIKNNTGMINSYLIMALGFSLALSTGAVNTIVILMIVLFLIENKYKKRFATIKGNIFVYLIVGVFVMHLVGLVWSDNLSMAYDTLRRMKKLLFIPFLMMYVKKEHIFYYFQAFISGMMISEILTYLIWFDVIPPFMHATNIMPAPLMKHFDYTVYTAMALFLLLYMLLFKKEEPFFKKVIGGVFASTMLLNLFFSGGRAGQVGFFILLFVLVVSYFKGRIFRGIGIFLFFSSTVFYLSYQYLPLFKTRVNQGIHAINSFQPGVQDTSLGTRFGLNINYYTIFKENPIIGIGTGDYIDEYKKINAVSKYITAVQNPHNMYMLMAVQFGILGLFIFLLPFGYQLYYGLKIKDNLRVIRIAFPVFFMSIMFVYWYFYAFKPLMLFVFFSSILYVKLVDNPKT